MITALAAMLPTLLAAKESADDAESEAIQAKDVAAENKHGRDYKRIGSAIDGIEDAIISLDPTTAHEAIAAIAVASGRLSWDDADAVMNAENCIHRAVNFLRRETDFPIEALCSRYYFVEPV